MSSQVPAPQVRLHKPAPRRWQGGRFLLLAVVVGMLASACSYTLPGRGSYPLDIFYEMHYQQSYKSHEPPRLSGVADAVAWFPAPRSSAFEANTGRYLYAVNCSMCHGTEGKGDGPVLNLMKAPPYDYKPVIDPPDLTDNPPESIMDIISKTTRPFGPDSVMPPFGKLLSADERQAIAQYIGAPEPPPQPPSQPESKPVKPPPTQGALQIGVNGDALQFDESEFAQIVAGQEVVLTLSNSSSINQHNWVLVQPGTKDTVALRGTTAGPGQDWLQPDDPDAIAHTKLLDPGETGEVRFTAPPAGTYQFVCTFPGHNVTMFGDFVVVP